MSSTNSQPSSDATSSPTLPATPSTSTVAMATATSSSVGAAMATVASSNPSDQRTLPAGPTSATQSTSYNRQSGLGNRRGNMKGKHLTRSHAMRECPSPPRTPTPRLDATNTLNYPQNHQADEMEFANNNNSNNNTNTTINNNNMKASMAECSKASNAANVKMDVMIIGTNTQTHHHHHQYHYNHHQQQHQHQQQQQQQLHVAIGNEQEFPKLIPPKSAKISQNHHQHSPMKRSNDLTIGTTTASTTATTTTTTNITTTHDGHDPQPNAKVEATGNDDAANLSTTTSQRGGGEACELISPQIKQNRSGWNVLETDQATSATTTTIVTKKASDAVVTRISTCSINATNESRNNKSNNASNNNNNNNSRKSVTDLKTSIESEATALTVESVEQSHTTTNATGTITTVSLNNSPMNYQLNSEVHSQQQPQQHRQQQQSPEIQPPQQQYQHHQNRRQQQQNRQQQNRQQHQYQAKETNRQQQQQNRQQHRNQQQQPQQQQQHHQQTSEKDNRVQNKQNNNTTNTQVDQQQQLDESLTGASGGSTGTNSAQGTSSPSLPTGTTPKKQRTTSKNGKGRIKHTSHSSSCSVEDSSGHPNSNNTSGFVSRVPANAENSGEQFTDFGGTDLVSFFRETINRNPKDRHFLMKIEKELFDLLEEGSDRIDLRFPSASSYNRMLIHRAAAYFGMDHNVDNETQQCVVVTPTRNSRVPEERFQDMFEQRERHDSSRKSVLRRDAHSFDDTRQSNYLCPNRGGMMDRRAKSFEQREEDYERARSRVFSRSHYGNEFVEQPHRYRNLEWPNYRVGEGQPMGEQPQRNQRGGQCQRQRRGEGGSQQNRNRHDSRLAKMQNSPDRRDKRPSSGTMAKAHSFGGYGGQPSHSGHHALQRGNSTNSHANGNSNHNTMTAALGSSNPLSCGGGVFTQTQQRNANNFVRPDGSLKTPWRVSPSRDEDTIYHYDPTHRPPNQGNAVDDFALSHEEASSGYGAAQTMAFTERNAAGQQPVDGGKKREEKQKHHQQQQQSSSGTTQQQQHQQSATTSGTPSGSSSNALTMQSEPPQPPQPPRSTNKPKVPQSQIGTPRRNPTVLKEPGDANELGLQGDDSDCGGIGGDYAVDHSAGNDGSGDRVQSLGKAPVAVLTSAQTATAENISTLDCSTQTQGLSTDDDNDSDDGAVGQVQEEPLSNWSNDRVHGCRANMDVRDPQSDIDISPSYSGVNALTTSMGELTTFNSTTATPTTATVTSPVDAGTTSCEPATPPADGVVQQPNTYRLSPNAPPYLASTSSYCSTPAIMPSTARDTPQSARSTPFNGSLSGAEVSRRYVTAEDSPCGQPPAWTLAQTYQTHDGTMFHTTSNPGTTRAQFAAYQQAPDGSIYAIPQSGMVYTYAPPSDTTEYQSYYVPIYDSTRSNDAQMGGAVIQTTAPAIYAAAAGCPPPPTGPATTVIPLAAATPYASAPAGASFSLAAPATAAAIYPGQVIYAANDPQIIPTHAVQPQTFATGAIATPGTATYMQQVALPQQIASYGYPCSYNGASVALVSVGGGASGSASSTFVTGNAHASHSAPPTPHTGLLPHPSLGGSAGGHLRNPLFSLPPPMLPMAPNGGANSTGPSSVGGGSNNSINNNHSGAASSGYSNSNNYYGNNTSGNLDMQRRSSVHNNNNHMESHSRLNNNNHSYGYNSGGGGGNERRGGNRRHHNNNNNNQYNNSYSSSATGGAGQSRPNNQHCNYNNISSSGDGSTANNNSTHSSHTTTTTNNNNCINTSYPPPSGRQPLLGDTNEYRGGGINYHHNSNNSSTSNNNVRLKRRQNALINGPINYSSQASFMPFHSNTNATTTTTTNASSTSSAMHHHHQQSYNGRVNSPPINYNTTGGGNYANGHGNNGNANGTGYPQQQQYQSYNNNNNNNSYNTNDSSTTEHRRYRRTHRNPR